MAEDGTGDGGFDWPEEPLDESFIHEANVYEPSAEERIAAEDRRRRQEALQARLASGDTDDPLQYRYAPNLEARPGVGAIQKIRGKRSRRRNRLLQVVAVIAAVALLGYMYQRPSSTSVADGLPELISGGPEYERRIGTGTDNPPPAAATSSTRLLQLPAQPPADDSFKFAQLDETTGLPTTYDPCRPIPYVTNSSEAPSGSEGLIDEAIAEISAATGLQFFDEGDTSEAADPDRSPFQPNRYGERWAPSLVAWTSPDTVTDLSGAVAGIGGSTSFARDGVSFKFVTGIVLLDSADASEILDFDGGRGYLRAIIMHEVAHLVGLDHVEDPNQVMNPSNVGITELAAGDLNGLYQLGQGTCVDEL